MSWDQILSRPWWTYDPATVSPWGRLYRGFNLFEAACWLVLAGLVLYRWWRCRKSLAEPAYAAAFLLFGLSDVREAWVRSAALVLCKGAILVALLALRRREMSQCYPSARVF
jgi:hypothetical protein